MRAGASLGWRVATAMAFVATAALAVTLTRGGPLHVALTSEKGAGTQHAPVSPQPVAATGRCAVSGKVLFIFPSRYLFAIGLSPIFSFRWHLPPIWSCIPKQLDSSRVYHRATGVHAIYGILTLYDAPFQETCARSVTENTSLDYNSDARDARFKI